MDINPVLFPQITNRESWSWLMKLVDDDTGEPLDLSGLTFNCEVRRKQNNPSLDVTGYTPFYDYGSIDDAGAVLTLALGSGLTVIDLGQLQLSITVAQMRTLAPATYSIALTASSTDDTRQIFLGDLPVLFGGVS